MLRKIAIQNLGGNVQHGRNKLTVFVAVIPDRLKCNHDQAMRDVDRVTIGNKRTDQRGNTISMRNTARLGSDFNPVTCHLSIPAQKSFDRAHLNRLSLRGMQRSRTKLSAPLGISMRHRSRQVHNTTSKTGNLLKRIGLFNNSKLLRFRLRKRLRLRFWLRIVARYLDREPLSARIGDSNHPAMHCDAPTKSGAMLAAKISPTCHA